MNGVSDRSSPYVSSDGLDSLDALPEDLFKQDSNLCGESSSSVEAACIEQKAISGLDVALSEEYARTEKHSVDTECFDAASENSCIQSELCLTKNPDPLLSSELDALPDGGFDDIVAMEAEGDSQFEQTMAMLRDLSGNEVNASMVSCVDDTPLEADCSAETMTDLSGNFNRTPASNDLRKNGITDDDVSYTLPASEPKLDTVQSSRHISSNAERKHKSSSGLFNRCIENLLQRGLETAARGSSPAQTDHHASAVASSNDSSARMNTASRSHRKSRKPTKLSHMRLSDDVVIVPAKDALPIRCERCTYTCNASSELSAHSAVCGMEVAVSEKHSGFTCTYCKTRFQSLKDFQNHLSHHSGTHSFHCFFCRYCDHSCDSIDAMDDHVTSRHPNEISRYEVSLEKVAYLQNSLECPVCGGGFLWKSAFVQHCHSDHHLEDLATHLNSTFSESPTPRSCKVSRQLFEGFADILLTDSTGEDTTEKRELSSKAPAADSFSGAGTVKRFCCDRCSFSADNWELWDRHMQEHHEQAADDYLQTNDDWTSSAPLVIDEDDSLPSVSINSPTEPQSQKMCQPVITPTLHGPKRNAVDTEKGPESSSMPPKKEGHENAGNMFPPGMEPELIPVNPGSGELPQLMKIGSGRKGVKLRCRLCPFECYRTPNFRRHLAIHINQAEYPESYRCAYCKFQHRRLNCIRFHLGKYHGQLPAKLSRVVRGKVVEVINADDVSLPAAKYGRALPVTASNFAPPTSTTYPLGALPTSSEAYAMSKKVETSTSAQSEGPVDDQSQLGISSSREKRLSKPPKRLSDSSEFQPPPTTFSSWRMRRLSAGGMETGSMAPLARLTGPTKGSGSRPFDDNIAEDYIQSNLPPGMIYPEPVKCPRCSFTNRVRINLVRHMKQHHTEDDHLHQSSVSTAAATHALPGSEPSWIENSLPSWARSQSTSPGAPQSIVKNAPMKMLRDGVTGGAFGSSRYLSKAPPKLPNRLGTLSGGDGQFTHGFLSSGRLEWNSEAGSGIHNDVSAEEEMADMVGINSNDGLKASGGTGSRESSVKRLFKCAYCAVSSRWNRRDISLHVLHVHVRRRAFRCRRCGYGTSKSASAVTVHCARTHPGRPAIIEDNLTVLNAILPLHTRPGVVLVAFRRPNGIPVMNLDELEEYFGLSKISTEEQKEAAAEPYNNGFEMEDVSLQYPSAGAPLDLSSQLQKDPNLGVSQAVFPTPYHDVLSQNSSPVRHSGTAFRKQSDCSDKMQSDSAAANIELSRSTEFPTAKDPKLDTTAQRSAVSTKDPSQFPPGTAFYRCRLCGYQDSRHDKTKYHVVREHLHLGPYGCAYCPRYMWGRRHVARHIAAVHPTMPVQIRRAFDEFETYLRENIRKIGGQPSRFPARKSSSSPHGSSCVTAAASTLPDPAPFPSALETLLQPSGGTTHAMEPAKRKATYQCGHCEYRDALAAKVQGHCLAKHPSKPVRYRRCEDSDDFVMTGTLADVKIESVESLAFGQDMFPTPDTGSSVSTTDVKRHHDLTVGRNYNDTTAGEQWFFCYSYHIIQFLGEELRRGHITIGHSENKQ